MPPARRAGGVDRVAATEGLGSKRATLEAGQSVTFETNWLCQNLKYCS